MKCQIKWINEHGEPTPDNNDAIGRVRMIAHRQFINGQPVPIGASQWFWICEQHAKQLAEPDMVHWAFEPVQS